MSFGAKTMTLGEFRKWTENLSDDIELNLSYGGGIFPIKAMDCLNENAIQLGGDIYGEQNIMGAVRVATFCKQKEFVKKDK